MRLLADVAVSARQAKWASCVTRDETSTCDGSNVTRSLDQRMGIDESLIDLDAEIGISDGLTQPSASSL
jgi:hypothetical protein